MNHKQFKFEGKILRVKFKKRSQGFELVRNLNLINIWFKFEDKVKNDSKVIAITKSGGDMH